MEEGEETLAVMAGRGRSVNMGARKDDDVKLFSKMREERRKERGR